LSLILLACLAFNYLNAQQVSGRVVDGGGLPIPGVNVVVGEINKVQTNFDGILSKASSTNVLIFSYIGMNDA
jgi:hypothetical protein